MNELHLFAGAGGGILGGMLLGHTCVCAVEIEPYPRKTLLQRQRDGILPRFPIWDDITTFDGRPWRGLVDVVCGGFPCQDISAAGKGAGLSGERSGLWAEMARIIREVGPQVVLVENSPILTSRGLGTVHGDLASMGYHARWGVLGADDAGAPHQRERIWISCNLANAKLPRLPKRWGVGNIGPISEELPGVYSDEQERNSKQERQGLANTAQLRLEGCGESIRLHVAKSSQRTGQPTGGDNGARKGQPGWWDIEPCVGRVANGVASRVDRLKAIGNGQVPAVAALAWRVLGGP